MVKIAISGLHGVGKTVSARRLAKKFGLRYFSAGKLFRRMAEEHDMSLEEFSSYVEDHPEIDRRIDRTTTEEAKNDDVVIDARLAGWMAEDADIRILLIAPLSSRARRIAEREGSSFEDVEHETVVRENSEFKRYRELYDIDVSDFSIFDIVVNTESFDEEEVFRILEQAVRIKVEK